MSAADDPFTQEVMCKWAAAREAAYHAAAWSNPGDFAAWKGIADRLEAHLEKKVVDWLKTSKFAKAWIKKNARGHKRLRHGDDEIKLYIVTRYADPHDEVLPEEFTANHLRRVFCGSGTHEGIGRNKATEMMDWHETWDPVEEPIGAVPKWTFDFNAGGGLFGHSSEHQPGLIDGPEDLELVGRDLMYCHVAKLLCDADDRLKLVKAAREGGKVTVQLRAQYTGA